MFNKQNIYNWAEWSIVKSSYKDAGSQEVKVTFKYYVFY